MSDWKREKLALLEELLGFMEQFQTVSGDDQGCHGYSVCPCCDEVGDTKTDVVTHKPDCKDTARRNELRAQIAELKKELGE